MSIESGKPYNVMNQRAGLSIYLSKDNKSLIGEKFEDSAERQLWIPVYLVSGGAHIKSKATGEYVGFEGKAGVGVKVVAGDSNHAKVWDIEADPKSPDYKIKLHGTSFVIEFPKSNLQPGTHAQLALDHSLESDHLNQVWVFEKHT